MNARNQRIVQYFATAWIPSSSQVGSNLCGFTIMGPQDNQLSVDILNGSLPAKVHISALLAASACRMKHISGLSFERDDVPELHTLKAIQALRKFVQANEPITDRVILDLFFLSLAEFYNKNHVGSKVHYQIMKQFVINLGGFAKLEPFIAWFVLSADYLLAASTVTAPVFDFTREPRLLGIKLLTTADKVEMAILRSILHLEPRMQNLIKDNISLAQVVAHLHQLPQFALSRVTQLVEQNGTIVYRLITMPLKVCGNQTPAQLLQARIADRLVSRSRHLAFVMWMWYSALGITDDISTLDLTQATRLMSSYTAEMRASLDYAGQILPATACTVRNDLLLWLHALGMLISPIEQDVSFHISGFVRTAVAMKICSYDQLESVLSSYLPLEQIPDYSLNSCYNLLITQWIFTRKDSTPPGLGVVK
jgi:hypothetical protein